MHMCGERETGAADECAVSLNLCLSESALLLTPRQKSERMANVSLLYSQ